MPMYCFVCTECGHCVETQVRDPAPSCFGLTPHRPGVMIRNYRLESVGFNGLAEMARQRELGLDGESGRKEQRDLFLPTVAEEGEAYIRDWNDRHGPAPTNPKPLYPDVPKRVF